MAKHTEATPVNIETEQAHLLSAAMESQGSCGDYDAQALHEVVQGLPSHIVKDLLSVGVCPQCIFRLFGVGGNIYSCSALSQLLSRSVLGDQRHTIGHIGSEEHKDSSSLPSSEESEVEAVLCNLCLGILQFTYCDEKGMLVKQSANEMAVTISEFVKREGHQIDSFSLEVSIPPIVLESEHSVWLYLQRKYGSDPWFQGGSLPKCISAKDALKFYLAKPLETLFV